MLYIPQKINAFKVKDEDTFSGSRAFLTYSELGSNNEKFSNQKSIPLKYDENIIIDNQPKKGFIINKRFTKHHNFFGQIQTILIYHPDGFEFEISLSNLMNILEFSDVLAQEIQQDCIIGWYNKYPYLITTNNPYFAEQKIKNEEILEVKDFKKDLVVGRSYYSKTEKNLIYIGQEEIIKMPSFSEPQNIKSRTGYIFLKDNQSFISLSKCQAAYSSEIHSDIETFKTLYEFQKEAVKFMPNKVYLISFKMNLDNSITKMIKNLYESYQYYINNCNNSFSTKRTIINSLTSSLGQLNDFKMYSKKYNQFFSLYFSFELLDSKEFKHNLFLRDYNFQIFESFSRYTDYSYYSNIPLIEEKSLLYKNIIDELNIQELYNQLIDCFNNFFNNDVLDTISITQILQKIYNQINYVGYQYSEFENFDFGLAHSSQHYISDKKYSDYDLESTNRFFSNVVTKELSNARNNYLFDKKHSELLKVLNY